MKVEGRHFPAPASATQIALVRDALPAATPPDYFDFLATTDGAEIWFDEDSPEGFDCLRFYSVAEMLDGSSRRTLNELMPTLLVIGGDQGSQFLAYDMEADAPWPIVMFMPGWGTEQVAPTFTDLASHYLKNIGDEIATKP